MLRALQIAVACASVGLIVGCGDASEPAYREPVSTSGQGGGDSSNGANGPASTPPSSPTDPGSNAPPPAPVTGNVFFRVANFLPAAADACLSPDGGATWIGPIMQTLAHTPLAPATVSARLPIMNAHFTARAIGGADCKVGVGADVTVSDIPGEWPATIVLGQRAGAPELRVLVDEDSLSDTSTFLRLVHAADWSTDADLGGPDGNGDFQSIFGDTPFLSTAKIGSLSKQGYAALDPIDNGTLILRTTTTQQVRVTVTVTANVDDKYTVFTMGNDQTSSLLFCDDGAQTGSDHLTPCVALADGASTADASGAGTM
jgi:hypothetical protein